MRSLAATLLLVVAASPGVRTQRPPHAAGRGVIAGRIVDVYGDPVINARVVVEMRAADDSTKTVGGAVSDDRGEYRIGHVPAGSYVAYALLIQAVVMSPGGPREPPRVYYPANTARAAEAEVIMLENGEERDDIDFVAPSAPAPLSPVIAMRLQQAAAAGAQPITGSSIVRGRVTTPNGLAVAHAHVLLVAPADAVQTRAGLTDAQGGFEFREVAAGKFRVSASKAGFAPVTYQGGPAVISGQLADSRDVEVGTGETRDAVALHLARFGAIAGQVLDERGEPMEGAQIQVLHLRYESGRQRLTPAPAMAQPTDDLGRYRLFGLAPGQYVVAASVSGGRAPDVPGYATSYYPGTANPAAAQFVSIGLAQEVDGIDIALARTRTATIAGQVLTAAGESGNPGSLTLLTSVRSASAVNLSIGARLNADGTFEFPNVPPGQYVIRADRGRSQPWMEGAFGTLPVVVDGTDVKDLVVPTSAGSSVNGRFVFTSRDTSKLPRPSAFELRPLAVDPDLAPQNVATAAIHDDWTFEMSGLNGPRRLQLTHVAPGWALEEILVRGVDVTDRALSFGRREQSLAGVEIRLTDRVTTLTGAVVDGNAHAVAGATLIVFATDRSRWYPMSRYLARTAADDDGAFSVMGLPFGSYYAAALTKVPVAGDDWQDPAFLETLIPRTTSVTVSESETRPVRLTVRN
jgi:hypothetical protein